MGTGFQMGTRTLFLLLTSCTLASFAPSASRSVPQMREKAQQASQKLHELAPSKSLSSGQAYQIAHFIETELPYWVERYGNYLSRKNTHLPRSLQRDPKNGDVYIHLQLHGGLERLGKGSKKMVTHSMLYDLESPQRMAHCQTEVLLKDEIKAIKALQDVEGLAEVRSVLKRKGKGRKKIYSFMCKLYGAGSLNHVIKYEKLAFKDKLDIAKDVIQALDSLHAHQFVHRDICPQNFLVEKSGGHFRAVMTDLGRTIKAKKAVGGSSQGHRFYNPPEALRKRKLKRNDYFRADVYATGCVLFELFNGKDIPWVRTSFIRGSQSAKKRSASYRASLTKYHKKAMSRLKRYMKDLPNQEASIQMKALIMRMVHPNPKKRGTAAELNLVMQGIYNSAK